MLDAGPGPAAEDQLPVRGPRTKRGLALRELAQRRLPFPAAADQPRGTPHEFGRGGCRRGGLSRQARRELLRFGSSAGCQVGLPRATDHRRLSRLNGGRGTAPRGNLAQSSTPSVRTVPARSALAVSARCVPLGARTTHSPTARSAVTSRLGRKACCELLGPWPSSCGPSMRSLPLTRLTSGLL